MDNSILRNTKKMLGVPLDDSSFDIDIVLHINSAFSILNQLGVGPTAGFTIEDEDPQWEDFIPTSSPTMRDLVKHYIYLRVKLAFDPPQNSFHYMTALQTQITEHEFRLNLMREEELVPDTPDPTVLDAGEI